MADYRGDWETRFPRARLTLTQKCKCDLLEIDIRCENNRFFVTMGNRRDMRGWKILIDKHLRVVSPEDGGNGDENVVMFDTIDEIFTCVGNLGDRYEWE